MWVTGESMTFMNWEDTRPVTPAPAPALTQLQLLVHSQLAACVNYLFVSSGGVDTGDVAYKGLWLDVPVTDGPYYGLIESRDACVLCC